MQCLIIKVGLDSLQITPHFRGGVQQTSVGGCATLNETSSLTKAYTKAQRHNVGFLNIDSVAGMCRVLGDFFSGLLQVD